MNGADHLTTASTTAPSEWLCFAVQADRFLLAIAKDPSLGVRVLLPELLKLPQAEMPPIKMRTALLGRLRLAATLARQFGIASTAGGTCVGSGSCDRLSRKPLPL
jgi:hypothetical protein